MTDVQIASDDLIAEVDGSLPVCSQFTVEDLPGWEQFLDPKYDPAQWQRLEMQRTNDCRANSGTSSVEALRWRASGVQEELARMFLYQSSEVIDNKLGADSGVSMQAGVKVMMRDGLPLESEYAYNLYTRKLAQFHAWCTPAVMASAATRKVVKASLAPEFEVAVAHVALGNPLDMASYWPLSFSNEDIGTGKQERVVRQYTGRHGRGGHAYASVFVVRSKTGELLLRVDNSHGYRFYLTKRAYTEMLDRRGNPFGMYQLAGSDDPKRDYYTGQFNIMGV